MKKLCVLFALAGLILSCSKDSTTNESYDDTLAAEARAFIITASATVNLTGQPYQSGQIGFTFDSLKLVGSDYEYGIRIGSGFSPSLNPGGQFSGEVLPQTYIAVDDTPTAMKFGLNAQEIDNWMIGREVIVSVMDKNNNLLGRKTERYYESLYHEEEGDIVVNLSGNQNVTDYYITFDVTFIPTYVHQANINMDYTFVNNTSTARTIWFEPGQLTYNPGLYTIPMSSYISEGVYNITVPANRTISGNILVNHEFYVLSSYLYTLYQQGYSLSISESGYSLTREIKLTGDNGVVLGTDSSTSPEFNLYMYELQADYKWSYTFTLN